MTRELRAILPDWQHDEDGHRLVLGRMWAEVMHPHLPLHAEGEDRWCWEVGTGTEYHARVMARSGPRIADLVEDDGEAMRQAEDALAGLVGGEIVRLG